MPKVTLCPLAREKLEKFAQDTKLPEKDAFALAMNLTVPYAARALLPEFEVEGEGMPASTLDSMMIAFYFQDSAKRTYNPFVLRFPNPVTSSAVKSWQEREEARQSRQAEPENDGIIAFEQRKEVMKNQFEVSVVGLKVIEDITQAKSFSSVEETITHLLEVAEQILGHLRTHPEIRLGYLIFLEEQHAKYNIYIHSEELEDLREQFYGKRLDD